jgi:hypothetical protein
MMLRPGQRLLTVLAAFAAGVAMLLFAFSMPATHAPKLHATDIAVVAADSHSHTHDGHSHDDVEVAQDTDAAQDHHHADHSHEKAELVRSSQGGARMSHDLDYHIVTVNRTDGPPYGIDRPPRLVTST